MVTIGTISERKKTSIVSQHMRFKKKKRQKRQEESLFSVFCLQYKVYPLQNECNRAVSNLKLRADAIALSLNTLELSFINVNSDFHIQILFANVIFTWNKPWMLRFCFDMAIQDLHLCSLEQIKEQIYPLSTYLAQRHIQVCTYLKFSPRYNKL